MKITISVFCTPLIIFFALFSLTWIYCQNKKPDNTGINYDLGTDNNINTNTAVIKSSIEVAYNNDGNDLKFNGENKPDSSDVDSIFFLNTRTFGLDETAVTKIFYCTGVFNLYKHLKKNDSINNIESFGRRHEFHKNNANKRWDYSWALIQNGFDPLQLIIDYGHIISNKHMDVIWSFRVNDTHDSADSLILSNWKKNNPSLLLSMRNSNSSSWCEGNCEVLNLNTALNYEKVEVRNQALKIIESILSNYDVDGIELDFVRHPIFFPNQMEGKAASQAQLDSMTSFVQRVYELCRKYSDSSKNILAIKIPDSMILNKEIGLDVENWLTNGYIDLITAGGYWHLEPWSNLVNLGSKYNVKVFADISYGTIRNSRFGVDGIHIKDSNEQKEYIRGEIINAIESGVDGIYIFNNFHVENEVLAYANKLNTLKNLNNKYTPLVEPLRGKKLKSWIRDGTTYNKLTISKSIK